jgi:hypothetical protein
MTAAIMNFPMNDGSGHFLSLPETIYPEDLVKRINFHTDLRERVIRIMA